MIGNGELSDPLCDSLNRGLTLVRLVITLVLIVGSDHEFPHTPEIHPFVCHPEVSFIDSPGLHPCPCGGLQRAQKVAGVCGDGAEDQRLHGDPRGDECGGQVHDRPLPADGLLPRAGLRRGPRGRGLSGSGHLTPSPR